MGSIPTEGSINIDHPGDGGGGLLALTATSRGDRILKVIVAGEESHVHLHQSPGTLWMANVASVRHQVIHTPSSSRDLLKMGSMTDLSTTCVMRSTLFPTSRRAGGIPSPQAHFEAANNTITNWIVKYGALDMPTLTEVKAAYADLFPTAGSTQGAASAACDHGDVD